MSLVGIGRERKNVDDTPAGRVLDCHARIRSFVQVAGSLAQAADVPAAEVADAAGRVHRYFTVALPLHVADEEQSIDPRVAQHAPGLREALAAMHREHLAADVLLAELVPAWAALKETPARDDLRRATARAAAELAQALEAHLADEERLIVPAITRLPPDEQQAILAEMRARRT
jgi:hypothetical protein